MTDNEALIAIDKVLAIEVPNAGPTWLAVIDICLWAKDAAKRLTKPKRTRREYMRDYMRRKRAANKLK